MWFQTVTWECMEELTVMGKCGSGSSHPRSPGSRDWRELERTHPHRPACSDLFPLARLQLPRVPEPQKWVTQLWNTHNRNWKIFNIPTVGITVQSNSFWDFVKTQEIQARMSQSSSRMWHISCPASIIWTTMQQVSTVHKVTQKYFCNFIL